MPGGIPICVYVPELKMFRVLHATGKCFASGGFGVAMIERTEKEGAVPNGKDKLEPDATNEAEETQENGRADDLEGFSPSPVTSYQHLFVEEALFLLERGLLEVYFGDKKWDSSRMYKFLFTESDVSLPLYLVYAHLRAQTFVVVRHTPGRLELLQQISRCEQEADTNTPLRKRKRTTTKERAALREDAGKAPPPAMMDDGGAIAFDVYQPNSNYRKTNPGPPDFYVAVTSYSRPSPPISQLQRLIQSCQGISLRIATVADSGTVIMFSLTDFGVPTIDSACSTNADKEEGSC